MDNNTPTVIIDNRVVELDGEKSLLELIRKQGIDIPTFCYNSELSVYGACRMCVVELEGRGIQASCSTPPIPGMKISTNSPRVQRVRRTVLELLLANHDRECTTCEKSSHCKLQELAERFGVRKIRFGERDVKLPLDDSGASLVRDPNKCILCGDCVRMCAEVQGIGVLNFCNRGSKVQVAPAFNKNIEEVDCVNCGQCSAVCPTGAIVVKSEINKAWAAIHDPQKMVVVQVAPAVRVALGEEFGLPAGEIVTGKMVAALKRLGFDKVFDTAIAADLTIMEETTEFLSRLQKSTETEQASGIPLQDETSRYNGVPSRDGTPKGDLIPRGNQIPQFTSCCPAWVKYAEHHYGNILPHLSSCRSPQQMFGSLVKRHWARELGKEPQNIFTVSIMPCTAKKFEAGRAEFAQAGTPDVDLVLTTQELARMIRESGLLFRDLDVESFDMPFGFTTGAGVIFGASGGVAEASIRAAYEMVTGETLEQVNFEEARGFKGLKEFSVHLKGQEIKVAVVHGLGNAQKMLQRIKDGEAQYHLVEVMACPGGCIGGAGQPIATQTDIKKARAKGIYDADKLSQLRKSQDNPIVAKFYEKWLEKPNSHEAHQCLHTQYESRGRIVGEDIQLLHSENENKLDLAVCVGTCCYLKGSYDTLKQLLKKADQTGMSDRINLHATFCMEGCSGGPSVRINEEVIGGVTPDKVDEVFQTKVLNQIK